MPKVEIDEAELHNLRNVAGFVDTALKNPKTREAVLKIDKALNPDKAIPELDAPSAVMAKLSEVTEAVVGLRKQIDDDRNARAEEERTQTLTRRVREGQQLLTESGYNAEGVAKIEAFMLENGIASYPAALAYFEKQNPRPTPADSSASRWGSMSDQVVENSADFKPLWESAGRGGEADAWVNAEVSKIRREFRS